MEKSILKIVGAITLAITILIGCLLFDDIKSGNFNLSFGFSCLMFLYCCDYVLNINRR